MHAQLLDIGWLLSRFYFKPAKVQRQYIWDVSQVETFHNDLVSAFEKDPSSQYYLGPVILTIEEADTVWVYDGQQRLTTLTIYMAVIASLTKGDTRNQTKVLSQAKTSQGNRARMDLRTSGGALTRVVNGTQTYGHSANMPVDWRIYNIEKMLKSQLLKVDDLEVYAKWVQRNVVLNVLWAEDEKGLVLFDRANNRGVKLEWHELVKSVLSEALGESYKAQKGKTLSQFWYEMEREADHEFSDLISCAAFIRYGTIDPSSALSKFEHEFDRSSKTATEIEESGATLFADLNSYRKTSKNLCDLREWDAKKNIKIRNEMELIEFQLLALEYRHWKSLLMFIEDKGLRVSQKLSFLKAFRYHAYIVHLLGWPNRQEYLEAKFSDLLDTLKAGNDISNNAGTYTIEQVAQAKGTLFGSMTDATTYRPIVRLWEAEQAYRGKGLNGYEHYFAHVEHILPRAPRKDWCRAFPDDNERAELRNKLGNFCLLSKSDNITIGNDDWAVKRKCYKGTHKSFTGAHSVAMHPDWTPETINNRTKKMANGIIEILGI